MRHRKKKQQSLLAIYSTMLHCILHPSTSLNSRIGVVNIWCESECVNSNLGGGRRDKGVKGFLERFFLLPPWSVLAVLCLCSFLGCSHLCSPVCLKCIKPGHQLTQFFHFSFQIITSVYSCSRSLLLLTNYCNCFLFRFLYPAHTR
jgi:hypothetical protein